MTNRIQRVLKDDLNQELILLAKNANAVLGKIRTAVESEDVAVLAQRLGLLMRSEVVFENLTLGPSGWAAMLGLSKAASFATARKRNRIQTRGTGKAKLVRGSDLLKGKDQGSKAKRSTGKGGTMIGTLPIIEPEVLFAGKRRQWFRHRGRLRSLLRQELWLADPHCRYCRRPLVGPWSGVLDHAVPRSRGGSNHATNALLACRACDRAKGNRTLEEWRAALMAGLFQLNPPATTPAETLLTERNSCDVQIGNRSGIESR